MNNADVIREFTRWTGCKVSFMEYTPHWIDTDAMGAEIVRLRAQVERVRELATNRAISVCDVYGNAYASGMLRATDVLAAVAREGE